MNKIVRQTKVMELETIQENEAKQKDRMNRGNLKIGTIFAFVFSIVFTTVVSISCNGKDDKNDPKTNIWDSSVDVYVVGTYSGGGAAIWKNGIQTMFPKVGEDAYNTNTAKSVFVVGNDVYVAGGNEYVGPSVLWKNGEPTILSTDARASSVYVVGNDVYVTGIRTIVNNSVPILWKNLSETVLAAGGNASSVYVTANDVYVAGTAKDGNGYSNAAVWKNGVLTNLQGEASEARSVFVSKNDIYIAGTTRDGDYFKAALWKNGQLFILNKSSETSFANSVYVVGDDVYVVGEVYNEDGSYRAALWKNGILYLLSFSQTDEKWSSANSVYVVGNDVYVAGHINQESTLWKNGVPIILENSGGPANSVFVVSR